jgi:hypothetical protein
VHPHVGAGLPGRGRDPCVVGVRVGQQHRADVAERAAGAFEVRPELREVPGQSAVDQHETAGVLQEVEIDLWVTESGDARGRRRCRRPVRGGAGHGILQVNAGGGVEARTIRYILL